MGFTFGFYDAYEHDRRYNARQMSSIFDGIITDGVFSTVGKSLIVKALEGETNVVIVQSGRAWFDHTWNYNDADLPLLCEQSDIILDRIDAVVLDINVNIDNRFNEIKIVKGIPAQNPVRPTLLKSEKHNQYPLAYIRRKQNKETIEQTDITNMVGTAECPLVTGILQQLTVEELLLNWQGQWQDLFVELKDMLGEDAALSLALRILELRDRVDGIDRQLTAEDGHKFRFRVNDKGKYGYIGKKDGADTFYPFSRGNFLEDTPLGSSYLGTAYNLGPITNGYSLAGKIPYYQKIRSEDFRVLLKRATAHSDCSANVDGYDDYTETTGNPVKISYNSSTGVISVSVIERNTYKPPLANAQNVTRDCYSEKWTSNRAHISAQLFVGTSDYDVFLILPPNYDER